MEVKDMKDKFIEYYNTRIQRAGSKELLDYLMKSDFFTAPASTRHHGAHEGGLVEHSVHVFERLRILCDFESEGNTSFAMPNPETIAICGLLHDLCKINFYTVEMRNRKNENGQWEKYPAYVVNDQLPYGHGEKSQYIIAGFMKLTREESIAIRWHMGGFDKAVAGGDPSLSGAFSKYPLALLTHMADMMATYLDENEN